MCKASLLVFTAPLSAYITYGPIKERIGGGWDGNIDR